MAVDKDFIVKNGLQVGANASITGDLTVTGDLIVSGNTTSINTNNLTIEDLNIVLANGAADATAANGAGITIDGANAQLTYVASGDKWSFNKTLDVPGLTATTADINGGTIDGTVIGGATPAAISGTTGSFSGNLTVDTNTLFVDAANNRVGIGTSSPSQAIEIAVPTAKIRINDTNRAGYSEIHAAATGSGLLFDADPAALDASTAIRFNVDGTERLRITSAGRVGIGTSSPDNRFHVVAGADGEVAQFTGAIANRGLSIFVETATDASALTRFRANSGGSAGQFAFNTDGNERLRITSTGSVGIGTTNPQRTLHIENSSGNLLRLNNSSTANGSYSLIEFVSTGGANSQIRGVQDSSTASHFEFHTKNGGAVAERLRITDAGNVGIGTSSPDGTLHVHAGSAGTIIAAAAANDLVVENNGPVGMSLLFDDATNNAYGSIYWGNETDGSGDGRITYFGSTYVVQAARQSMTFSTAGTERMRITATGNVGIGDSNPAYRLHSSVSLASSGYLGNAAVYALGIQNTNTTAGNAVAMAFGHGGYDFTSYIASIRKGTGADPWGDISIGGRPADGAGFVDRLYIKGDTGNVGIGTSSPANRLSLLKGVAYNTDSALFMDMGINDDAVNNNATYNWRVGLTGDATGHSYTFSTIGRTQGSYTERLRIDASGNVGIGVSSPTEKLDVFGPGATGQLIRNSEGVLRLITSGGINFIQSGLTLAGGSVAPLVFTGMYGSPERMRITSTGSVGIGVSNPVDKLQINGGLHVTGAYSEVSNGGGGVITSFAANAGSILSLDPQVAWKNLDIGSALTTFSTLGGERARIDASGNLLVGKTSFGLAADGVQLSPLNSSAFTADNNIPLFINRRTSDGDLIQFRKDGTTVGSVGTVGGDLIIGTGDTGLYFNDATNQIHPYNIVSLGGGSVDGAIDLGQSLVRFKDLYLSGGVYLGGTGSANLLDDYEEGSFVGRLGDGVNNVDLNSTCVYTKVGRLVTVAVFAYNQSFSSLTATNQLRITNLPFTSSNYMQVSVQTHNVSGYPLAGAISTSGTQADLILMYGTIDSIAATRNNILGGAATFSFRASFSYFAI